MNREPTATQLPRPPAPTLPRGVIGVLLAVTLAGGMATGAVLGPASASPALSNSELVQRALALLAAQASGAPPVSAAPPPEPAKTTTPVASAPAGTAKATLTSRAGATSPSPSEAGTGGKPASKGTSGEEKAGPREPARLPPVQHVWLIVLDGSTFATATSSDYPYLAGQLIAQGTLLTSYSALDGYELAGDAALLPGGVGASVRPVLEPGCGSPPASGAGAPCAQTTQATPAQADAFAQSVVGSILSSAPFHENGLVVITFAPASEEAGVPVSTLALQPAAGTLLLSPLLHGGTRSATPFDSLSPRTSLEAIFVH